MTGLEVAVGWLAAYAWQKARRAAGRADGEVDRLVDTAMDRLHDLVSTKLSDDPAVLRLVGEAGEDLDVLRISDRTRQRVQLALEDATEDDPGFAQQLQDLVAKTQQVGTGTGIGSAVATQTGTALATDGGVANSGVVIGDVNAGGR